MDAFSSFRQAQMVRSTQAHGYCTNVRKHPNSAFYETRAIPSRLWVPSDSSGAYES
jgi:hypothetical protein